METHIMMTTCVQPVCFMSPIRLIVIAFLVTVRVLYRPNHCRSETKDRSEELIVIFVKSTYLVMQRSATKWNCGRRLCDDASVSCCTI